MYWTDSNSNIDSLLSQENTSLVQILLEDDVLQECISNNQSLINYLTSQKRVHEMIRLMMGELNLSDGSSISQNESIKIASVVSELFTYKDNVFSSILVEDNFFLEILWSFVSHSVPITKPEKEDEQSGPEEEPQDWHTKHMNPLNASFFSKVMNYLFQQKLNSMLDFISAQKEPNDLVSVVLRTLDYSGMMDFIFKIWEHVNTNREQLQQVIFRKYVSPTCVPEDLDEEIRIALLPEEEQKKLDISLADKFDKIIVDGRLLDRLIALFKYPQAEAKQMNAAHLISDLVRTGRENLLSNSKAQVDVILKQCESMEFTRAILRNMFESKTRCSIVNALRLIQDLLVYRIQVEHMSLRHKEHLSSLTDPSIKSDEDDRVEDVQGLEAMPDFLKEKIPAQSTETFITPQLNSPDGAYGEHLQRCIHNVSTALYEKLDDFIELLFDPIGPIHPIATTIGTLQEPLGLIRLEVTHLFVAMFATADSHILEKCAELNVLKIFTDLFFKYKLNNQMHKYYEQIINYVIHNYSSFRDIHVKQTKKQAATVPAVVEGDEQQQQPTTSAEVVTTHNNNEKMLNFAKLYDVSRKLMIQVIVDCRLIEKIIDNYANEEIPIHSKDVAILTKKAELNKTFDVTTENTDNKTVEEKPKETETTIEKIEKQNKNQFDRPGYLGHLRLIANKFNNPQIEEILGECPTFTEETKAQWQEFKAGKLAQLNELCETKLVEEPKLTDAQEQELYTSYLTDSITGPSLPNVELLPSDFESNSLKEARDQSKLMDAIDFDFDCFWTQEQNEKMEALEKIFNEKCSSSLFDDDEAADNGNDMDVLAELREKKEVKKDMINQIIQEDLNDPFAPSNGKTTSFNDLFNDVNWESATNADDVWTVNEDTPPPKEIQPVDGEKDEEEQKTPPPLPENDFKEEEEGDEPSNATTSAAAAAAAKSMFHNVPVDENVFAQINSSNTSSPKHEDLSSEVAVKTEPEEVVVVVVEPVAVKTEPEEVVEPVAENVKVVEEEKEDDKKNV